MTTTLAPPDNGTEVDNTARVLDTIEEIFQDYVIFPDEFSRDAVILWVAHAHVFYAFESTPRLSVSSSEPGSGKSRVLEIIEHLVPNPLNAVYMTPGVMWRSIEHTAPTILLDEVDTIFGKNGSGSAHRYLRGIINAGHRKGATVPRTVGSEDVKHFRVFAPVAMAGLGRLPETIASRSVEIIMRRRRGSETIRPFRLKFAQDALIRARSMLEEWAMDAADMLEFSYPETPVQDRDADVWEPLLAIAEMAGEEWFERATKACEELTIGRDEEKQVSPGVRLLTQLRDLFGDRPVMFTVDILAALRALPDTPWDMLTPRSLGNVLAEYDVRPTTVREGDNVAKGYKASDLEPVWNRYVKISDQGADQHRNV